MDFGLVGVDGFVVGSQSSTTTGAAAPPSASSTQVPSAPDTKPRILGSGLGKQARTFGPGQDEWSAFKISRSGDLCPSRAMPLHQGTPLLRSNSILSADTSHQEHMLSFSQPKPEASPFLSRDGGLLLDRSSQNQAAAFSYYQPAPSSSAAYNKIPGYVNGSLNSSMHGPINGVRGPFTPSQWMELEHQALIYKYLSSNVPVPSNLLLPLKKSVYPCGLSTFSAGSYPPNSLGWGSFHLGYPGNTNDPEPGRCRRTDGKKWRCSRDAVADQKYCERHINRGRHRSRKPVEGQSGHSATGTTSSKVVPMTTSVSTPVIVSGGASNSLVIAQQQLKNLEPATASSSASLLLNRYRSNLSKDISGRVQHPRGGSTMSSAVNMKKEESSFAIPGQKTLFEDSSQPEFGLVSSDSLLNPSERSSYMNSKNYESYLNFGDQQTQDQHPLRQFMDDWPKDQGSRSVISWPEELKSDWTQLSISIPMASSEFSSSSSSPPTHEKFILSPLRLSREFEPTQMGLGMSSEVSESTQKQTNRRPLSWGAAMAGPLGEVLTTSSAKVGSCKSSSGFNLLTEGWDGSPQLGSSPTGVLQKATFGSLSNSSSGSSPRTEGKKIHEVAGFYDDMFVSTIASSSPVPSL